MIYFNIRYEKCLKFTVAIVRKAAVEWDSPTQRLVS